MDGHLSTFLNLDGIPWRVQLYYIFYSFFSFFSLKFRWIFLVFVYKIKGLLLGDFNGNNVVVLFVLYISKNISRRVKLNEIQDYF